MPELRVACQPAGGLLRPAGGLLISRWLAQTGRWLASQQVACLDHRGGGRGAPFEVERGGALLKGGGHS